MHVIQVPRRPAVPLDDVDTLLCMQRKEVLATGFTPHRERPREVQPELSSYVSPLQHYCALSHFVVLRQPA